MKSMFDGPDLIAERDDTRLGAQLIAVRDLMKDGIWRSLKNIEYLIGYPQASISARLRDLRKERFGQHTVERRRLDGGQYEYRVLA